MKRLVNHSLQQIFALFIYGLALVAFLGILPQAACAKAPEEDITDVALVEQATESAANTAEEANTQQVETLPPSESTSVESVTAQEASSPLETTAPSDTGEGIVTSDTVVAAPPQPDTSLATTEDECIETQEQTRDTCVPAEATTETTSSPDTQTAPENTTASTSDNTNEDTKESTDDVENAENPENPSENAPSVYQVLAPSAASDNAATNAVPSVQAPSNDVANSDTASNTASNSTTASETSDTPDTTSGSTSDAPSKEAATDAALSDSQTTKSDPLPTTKYATPISPGEYLILRTDSYTQVLDVAGGPKVNTKNCANVQLYKSNNTAAQTWRVAYDQDGAYTFTNVKSGKLLDAAGGQAANGTNVWQYASNNTPAQKWILVQTETGIRIESALNRAFVLDCSGGGKSNGTNIQLYRSNATPAQRFSFLTTHPHVESERTVENGVYTIDSLVASNKMVDVAGGSAARGANVQIYSGNNTTAQRWNIVYGDDGFYTVTSVESGMVLDAAGGLIVPTTNVQQYSSNGTDAQKWAIRENKDGSYSFVNKKSNLSLQVQGGKTADGTNVFINRSNSSNSQKFELKRVPVLADGTYVFYSRLAPTAQAMDVRAGSVAQNAPTQTWVFNNSTAQRFVVKHLGDDIYSVQSVLSGRYLTENAGKEVQQARNGEDLTDAQQWKISMRGSGIVFTNTATGKAVSANTKVPKSGAMLTAATYTGAASQKFRPVKQSQLIAQGLYTLESRTSKAVVDVSGGSWGNNANVQTYASNKTNAQKFALIPAGGGYYRLVMALSGNVVQETGKTEGANVRMSTNNGATPASQLWRPELTDNGIVFRNKESGLLLEAAANKAVNGTNIRVARETGSSAQAFNVKQTTVNLTDTANLRKLIQGATTGKGKTPKLDANGRSYRISNAAYKQLTNALAKAWNRGQDVTFVMADMNTGMTLALNADRTVYGASTTKAAYVTYLFSELIEKGKVKYSSISGLMRNTVVWSNNDTYATLFNRYGNAGFKKWLNTAGVGWVGNTMYTNTNSRTLATMWSKILTYEQSGGKYVSQWRNMFNKSYYSFIRQQLSGSNTVYSKPGWMFGGTYGAIHDDGAIVRDRSGRTYVLAVMSTTYPSENNSVTKGVVKALDRIHQEMPKL